MEKRDKQRRGFAAMAPEKRRALAARGGRAVPKEKRSFSQSRELAQQAGTKGGSNVPAKARSFSHNRKLAKEAGRKGGMAQRKAKTPKPAQETTTP